MKGAEIGKRRQARRWLPWAVLAAAFCLVTARSFLSFCWADESFYLAIAHRFWLGELPFVDEWNPAQIYVVLLMPFYSLYRTVFGTADGVFLAARLAYAVLSGAAAAFVYAALQKESRAGACAGAVLCLLYSRANIGGLSYYNLSLIFCLFGCAALFRAAARLTGGGAADGGSLPARADGGQNAPPPAGGGAEGFGSGGQNTPLADGNAATSGKAAEAKARRAAGLFCLFAGAAMALAVVCTPFFALFWLAALLPLGRRFARWRLPAGCFILGSAASAGAYLAWVLRRVPLARLLEMLPYVMSDPEANERSLKTVLMAFALPVYQFRWTLPLWGGALLWAGWRVLVRRRPFAARDALGPAGLAGAALAIELALSGRMPGRPHTALCLAAACLFLLLPAARRPMRSFLCFGVPGAVLAFSWQLSSNTRFSGMTIGFSLASVWAAVTAERFAGWLRGELCGAAGPVAGPAADTAVAGPAAGAAAEPSCGAAAGPAAGFALDPAAGRPDLNARLLRALPAVCLVLCLVLPCTAAAVQRAVLVYRDDPITLCNTRIEAGPARGLYTSAQNAQLYGEVYELLASLPPDSGPLYLSSLLPWGYLVNDLRCGAPASWRAPLDFAQLPDYYRVNPQNFPRTVLALGAGYGRYRSTVEGTEENYVNANVTESWFLDELAARGYRCTETRCGLLWQAP